MRFLLVDDNADDRQLILRALNQGFGEVQACEISHKEDFLLALKRGDFEIVITDYHLPWSNGLEILQTIHKRSPNLPVIMVTGTGNEEVAVKAMKSGLSDYVLKTHLQRLPVAVEESIAKAKFRREHEVTLEQLRQSEERYRAVSELTSDYSFACRVEMDGRVVVEWVTDAFQRIVGCSAQEVSARNGWKDLVHPDDLPIARRFVQKVISGQPDSVEFRIVLESGEIRWMRHFAHPVWDEVQNRVLHIFGAAQDITARQRSEERLRQTTLELQAIFNALPDLYFRLDADGTIVDYHTPRPSDLYVPPEAFLGKRMQSVLPADVSLQLFQAMIKVRRTGLLTRVEYELPLRSGLRRFEARLLPLREKQIIAIIRDITDPKRAEQALLRRERQLDTLARSSQQVNTVLEVPVILRTVVSSAMALVDATAGMAGLQVEGEMVFTEHNRQGNWTPVDYKFMRGQSVAGRVIHSRLAYFTNQATSDTMVSPDLQKALGVENLACVPILNRVGELLGCIEVHNTVGRRPFDAHDVAMLQGLAASAAIALENAWMLIARQRTEEILRQSEERFRLLFESAPVGILIARQHVIIYANPASVRMFSYPNLDAFTTVSLLDLLTPTQRDIGEQLIQALEQKQALLRTMEFTGMRSDGSLFPFYLELTRMQLPDGAAIVAFITDLSDRSNLESQLRQAQKMEFIGQLSSGMAHDFNNILTIIQGHVDLLMAESNLGAEAVESLQQVAAATNRASRLTQQLLTFSQQQPLRLIQLDLNELIRRLTGILGRLLGETVTLELQYETSLPEILADQGMIEQVLINLLVNARDAMPKGGSIQVATQVREIQVLPPKAPAGSQPGSFVVIRVTDNGRGMDEATQRRLFEPFFTTKESGQGTGLGLATVYGIIKQHRGWLEVHSKMGQGSTFEIYLPTHSEGEKPTAKRLEPIPLRRGSGTILLVEDDEPVRVVVRTILRHHGYQVLEAGSGIDALRVWTGARDQIDLLVTDIVMPEGMSGRELVQQLRAQKKDLKVIYASGYKKELDALNVQPDQDTQLLVKPFNAPNLMECVHQCLGIGKA
jgi:PAS domain S-box-containing protein